MVALINLHWRHRLSFFSIGRKQHITNREDLVFRCKVKKRHQKQKRVRAGSFTNSGLSRISQFSQLTVPHQWRVFVDEEKTTFSLRGEAVQSEPSEFGGHLVSKEICAISAASKRFTISWLCSFLKTPPAKFATVIWWRQVKRPFEVPDKLCTIQ